MNSAKHTNKEAVQAIQELDLGEDTCSINRYIQKRMQNNDIFLIMNMERPDISHAVYTLLQHSKPTIAFVEGSFSMRRKLLAKDRKLRLMIQTFHNFIFQFLPLVIKELADHIRREYYKFN